MTKRDLSQVPEFLLGKVQELININADYSQRYLDQILDLDDYRIKHPTKIAVFKCMDGRILFSSFTKTPLGFLRNFRNLGGQFNMGWKPLQYAFRHFIEEPNTHKSGNLIIVTYHWSKGEPKRGCAGHGYNQKKSIEAAFAFKRDVDHVSKSLCNEIECIVVGIETDEDALVLHGEHSEIIELAEFDTYKSKKEVFKIVENLYPSMPMRMKIDFLPLVMNNIEHIAEVREEGRSFEEMDHQEWVVGIGSASAFNWFHKPNVAVLVGLYNPNIERPIQKAFGVVKKNAKNGLILLAGASYGGHNPREYAEQEVKWNSRFLKEQAQECCPDLVKYMYSLRILLNSETQKFEII
jgi:hypothetical protein